MAENLGLYQIYGSGMRQNPWDKKAAMAGAMINKSGFAAPLVAAVAGDALNKGAEWDEQREATMTQGLSQLREHQQQKDAVEVLGKIITLAKEDPAAATKALSIEAERMPSLAPYKGLQFNSKVTKEGWVTVTSNGQAFQVYLPNLPDAVKAGKDSDIFKSTIIPIGEGKGPEQPYKVGQRVKHSISGRSYEGTYKGLDKNNNPIFEDDQPVKEEGSDAAAAAKEQAKVEQSKAVRVLVAEKFAEMIPDDLKASISDTSGAVDPTRVRSALVQGEKDGKVPAGAAANYDRTIIDAEEGVGKGKKSIAKSVDDALVNIHGGKRDVAPAGGGSTLPPDKAKLLKDGTDTTFGNGQVWTLRGGKPFRVR